MKAPSSTTPVVPSALVTVGESRVPYASSPPASSMDCDGGADVGELLQGGEGAHGDALGARVAEHHALVDPVADGGDDVGHQLLRARSRGGSTVHFWPALTVISVTSGLDEGVELRRALDGVRAEDRGVERVGLAR